jgi:hypothetical protein
MQRLFFVALVDRAGDVLAGGHFLAKDAAAARSIGHLKLTEVSPDLPAELAQSIRAKLAGWYAIRAKPSSANPANALNAPVKEAR